LIRFLIALFITAGVIAGFSLLILEHTPSFFYQTLVFLVFGTALIYRYLYKLEKPDIFVQLYLLTMMVKFLAYGAYMLFVILEDRPSAAPNVAFFMIVYFIFTILEIVFLYRKIMRQ
jgi:hypothetical protein